MAGCGVVTILMTILFTISAALAEVYTWTDIHGEFHASDTPPSESEKSNQTTVPQDAQKHYLEFMASYDQKWKAASAAERVGLEQEWKRLTQEAGNALKGKVKLPPSGTISQHFREHETLGSIELRQARSAMLQAQRDIKNAHTMEEKERKSAEYTQLQDRYLKTLSRTNNEDQTQSLRVEGYLPYPRR